MYTVAGANADCDRHLLNPDQAPFATYV
jgi:hypothetical protein